MKEIKNKNIKWWIGLFSFVGLFLVIGVFAYSKMCFIVKGVTIEANINKSTENSNIATVEGNANNAIHLKLNGREIFIDKDGSFSETISLLPGLSVIKIDAVDKFGNKSEKRFELVNKENAPSLAFKITEEEIIN